MAAIDLESIKTIAKGMSTCPLLRRRELIKGESQRGVSICSFGSKLYSLPLDQLKLLTDNIEQCDPRLGYSRDFPSGV